MPAFDAFGSDRVEDHVKNGDEYEALLEDAEDNATKGQELDFVSDLRLSWERHGMRAYLSKKQFEWLSRIAGR